ncbi:unnamed protein product [Pleuronectes platessa]|uniref:Uncharacterized protein n=1 Tax=Pleuronectes platessa TaxID=8262 RepID=A0A9N7UWP8_PLEPL|nr:unnamed protein product [Pleuronectes platessa]
MGTRRVTSSPSPNAEGRRPTDECTPFIKPCAVHIIRPSQALPTSAEEKKPASITLSRWKVSACRESFHGTEAAEEAPHEIRDNCNKFDNFFVLEKATAQIQMIQTQTEGVIDPVLQLDNTDHPHHHPLQHPPVIHRPKQETGRRPDS